jgi:hypothetical protein
MKRSTLIRINLLWTLAWMTMLLAGCTASWVNEATNIISLLGPAITSILAILAAFGVGLSPSVASALEKWSTDAETGLQQVGTLINQYNAAEATAQPGILAEIQTLLGVINTNLTSILPTIHVTDPSTQAKILAIVEAFQSELSALIALVPALQGKVADHDEAKRLMAAVKSANSFKIDFNAKVDAFGPTASKFHI